MDERTVDYARMVTLMASQGILPPDVAMDCCRSVLPTLLSEIEILQGMADRLSQVIAAAVMATPSPAVAEPEPALPQKPQPKRRGRRKKEVAND